MNGNICAQTMYPKINDNKKPPSKNFKTTNITSITTKYIKQIERKETFLKSSGSIKK